MDFFSCLTSRRQKSTQSLWWATLWWVSVAPQPRTTCHEPRRTLRQPPRHTRCLGRSNVDLWRRTAPRSRWPPSCWAVFGLMNKRSPPNEDGSELTPAMCQRSHREDVFLKISAGLLWRTCTRVQVTSVRRNFPGHLGLLACFFFSFLFLLNAEQLVDSWGGKMLIIFWPFLSDLCYCLFRE